MPRTTVRREGEHLYAAQPKTESGRALCEALLRLRRAEHQLDTRALLESGMSNLDFRALRYMVQASRDEQSLSPKDLRTMLGTSSANVTNVVDRLAKRGLVERRVHPRDRRAHYLDPTAKAITQVDEVLGGHHSAMVSYIDGLDDKDAAAAARILVGLAKDYEAIEADGPGAAD